MASCYGKNSPCFSDAEHGDKSGKRAAIKEDIKCLKPGIFPAHVQTLELDFPRIFASSPRSPACATAAKVYEDSILILARIPCPAGFVPSLRGLGQGAGAPGSGCPCPVLWTPPLGAWMGSTCPSPFDVPSSLRQVQTGAHRAAATSTASCVTEMMMMCCSG